MFKCSGHTWKGGMLKQHHIDDQVFDIECLSEFILILATLKTLQKKKSAWGDLLMAVSKMRSGYVIKMQGDGTNPEPMGLPDLSFQWSRHIFWSQTKAGVILGPSTFLLYLRFMVESQNSLQIALWLTSFVHVLSFIRLQLPFSTEVPDQDPWITRLDISQQPPPSNTNANPPAHTTSFPFRRTTPWIRLWRTVDISSINDVYSSHGCRRKRLLERWTEVCGLRNLKEKSVVILPYESSVRTILLGAVYHKSYPFWLYWRWKFSGGIFKARIIFWKQRTRLIGLNREISCWCVRSPDHRNAFNEYSFFIWFMPQVWPRLPICTRRSLASLARRENLCLWIIVARGITHDITAKLSIWISTIRARPFRLSSLFTNSGYVAPGLSVTRISDDDPVSRLDVGVGR